MGFLSFVLVSTVEYSAMLLGILALYRFQIRYSIAPIVVISLVCSFLSHALRIKYEVEMAPVIQLVVLILLFWLMFRVPFIYSCIMIITYFVVYILLQALLLLLLPAAPWFDEISLQSLESPETYSMQIICAAANIAFAWYLQSSGRGFTFVPNGPSSAFPWKRENLKLFILIMVGFLVLAISYYLYVEHFHILVPLVMLTLGLFIAIFHYSILKEKNQ